MPKRLHGRFSGHRFRRSRPTRKRAGPIRTQDSLGASNRPPAAGQVASRSSTVRASAAGLMGAAEVVKTRRQLEFCYRAAQQSARGRHGQAPRPRAVPVETTMALPAEYFRVRVRNKSAHLLLCECRGDVITVVVQVCGVARHNEPRAMLAVRTIHGVVYRTRGGPRTHRERIIRPAHGWSVPAKIPQYSNDTPGPVVHDESLVVKTLGSCSQAKVVVLDDTLPGAAEQATAVDSDTHEHTHRSLRSWTLHMVGSLDEVGKEHLAASG